MSDDLPSVAEVGASEREIEALSQHLVQTGKLTPSQVTRIRDWQSRHGQNFADAAVSMGLVRREDIMAALSRRYSYPILHGDPDSDRFSQELFVGHEPFGQAAERVRSIRSTLASTAVASGTRSFIVTGPRSGAGTTFFAGNLALAFAQMAIPTLLVDANLRTPRVADLFGLDSHALGLTDILRRKNLDHMPIFFGVIPGLSILTAGELAPNPQELLSSAEFLALVNVLQKEFGVVVYDTAPAMEYADAYVVAARVGAGVVVARQHRTSYNDVSAVTQKLRTIQCNVLGSVLNAF